MITLSPPLIRALMAVIAVAGISAVALEAWVWVGVWVVMLVYWGMELRR